MMTRAVLAAGLLLVTSFGAAPDDPRLVLPPGAAHGFHTLQQMEAVMASMHEAAPRWVSQMQSIGSSVEGRPLNAVCIGFNACKGLGGSSRDAGGAAAASAVARYRAGLLLTAMHHAREPLGASAMLSFGLDIVRRLAGGDYSAAASLARMGGGLWLLPCANPDAYILNIESLTWNDANPPVPRVHSAKDGIMARKNRRPGCTQRGWGGSSETVGVDTNRNYDFFWAVDDQGSSPNVCAEDYRGPQPFSEPESAAVAALVEQVPFSVALNLHSYGRFINLPYAVQRLGSPPAAHYALFLSLASQMAAATGFGFGHPWSGGLYSVNGEASDWMWAHGGVLAMSPELGPFMEFNPFERGMWPAEVDLPALTAEAVALLHVAWAATGPRPQVSVLGSNAAAGQPWVPGDLVELRLAVTNGGAVDFSGSLRVTALPLDDGLLAFGPGELADAVAKANGLASPLADGQLQPKAVRDAAGLLGRVLSTTWAALLTGSSGGSGSGTTTGSSGGSGLPAVCAALDLPAMPAGDLAASAYSGGGDQLRRLDDLHADDFAGAAATAALPIAAHAQALAAKLKGRAGAALEAAAAAGAGASAPEALAARHALAAQVDAAVQRPLEQRISLQRSLDELLADLTDRYSSSASSGETANSAGASVGHALGSRSLAAGGNDNDRAAPTPSPVPVEMGGLERLVSAASSSGATSSSDGSGSGCSSGSSGGASRLLRLTVAAIEPWRRTLPPVEPAAADAVPAAASVPGLGSPAGDAVATGSGSGNGEAAHAHAPAGQAQSLSAVLPPTFTSAAATFAFTVAPPPSLSPPASGSAPGASGGADASGGGAALPQVTPPQLLQVTLPALPISPAVAAALTPEQQAARGARVSLAGAVVVSDDLLCWIFGVTATGAVSTEPLAVLQAACPPCAALRAKQADWTAAAVAAAAAQNMLPPLDNGGSGNTDGQGEASPQPAEPTPAAAAASPTAQASPAAAAASPTAQASPAAAAASPTAQASPATVPASASASASAKAADVDVTGSGSGGSDDSGGVAITGTQLGIIAGGAILGIAAGCIATRALARRLLREPDADAAGGSAEQQRRRRGTGAAAAAVRMRATASAAAAGLGRTLGVQRQRQTTAYERVAEAFDDEEDDDDDRENGGGAAGNDSGDTNRAGVGGRRARYTDRVEAADDAEVADAASGAVDVEVAAAPAAPAAAAESDDDDDLHLDLVAAGAAPQQRAQQTAATAFGAGVGRAV